MIAYIIPFALFFFSDINDWKLGRRWLRFLFPAGFLLLAIATLRHIALEAYSALPACIRLPAMVLSALSLLLLLYTLFFAVPPGPSYLAPGRKRAVRTTGIYALCRHPGVLWLALFYASLIPAAGFPVHIVLLVTFLDIPLVLFEDRLVFPSLMEGYERYRVSTPFLIPNTASVKRCRASLFSDRR